MATDTAEDVPALTDLTVVITGANSGIGRVAARVLADRGARVVLAVRNVDKGREAADTMTGTREVRHLDLADLSSIRTFADELDGPVDILINNAGIMMPPLGRTADGFESQFGTNHLGHFALTNLLLPRITRRVVTVSSNGHRMGKIDLHDLNWERRRYRALGAYAQSKLANLLFTSELQRRLDEANSTVLATAAHPGTSATNLFRPRARPSWIQAIQRRSVHLLTQSAEDGALPTLYAAVEDLPGNSYVGPSGFQQMRGAPTLVGRSTRAQDAQLARSLWTVSEELTGVRFPLGSEVRPPSTGPA